MRLLSVLVRTLLLHSSSDDAIRLVSALAWNTFVKASSWSLKDVVAWQQGIKVWLGIFFWSAQIFQKRVNGHCMFTTNCHFTDCVWVCVCGSEDVFRGSDEQMFTWCYLYHLAVCTLSWWSLSSTGVNNKWIMAAFHLAALVSGSSCCSHCLLSQRFTETLEQNRSVVNVSGSVKKASCTHVGSAV